MTHAKLSGVPTRYIIVSLKDFPMLLYNLTERLPRADDGVRYVRVAQA